MYESITSPHCYGLNSWTDGTFWPWMVTSIELDSIKMPIPLQPGSLMRMCQPVKTEKPWVARSAAKRFCIVNEFLTCIFLCILVLSSNLKVIWRDLLMPPSQYLMTQKLVIEFYPFNQVKQILTYSLRWSEPNMWKWDYKMLQKFYWFVNLPLFFFFCKK